MGEPILQLDTICKVYNQGEPSEVTVLRDINLSFHKGEFVAIMGPSGSGKSTLLNIIGLLDRPTTGRLFIHGQDTQSLDDHALTQLRGHSIGFVFQSFHLVPRLSAAQNIELPLVLAGVPPRERTPRVQAALAALGLESRAGHRPSELSGGQRQRVAIARAMIMRPPLLLADEPTGNLDSASGAQVVDILESLHREQGVTLLVVTHDAALGMRASRRIRISDGRIAADEH